MLCFTLGLQCNILGHLYVCWGFLFIVIQDCEVLDKVLRMACLSAGRFRINLDHMIAVQFSCCSFLGDILADGPMFPLPSQKVFCRLIVHSWAAQRSILLVLRWTMLFKSWYKCEQFHGSLTPVILLVVKALRQTLSSNPARYDRKSSPHRFLSGHP